MTLRKPRPIFLAFLVFTHSAQAQEEYIWKDAIVLDNATFGLWEISAPLDDLIHGSTFKDKVLTKHKFDNTFFTIDQGEPLKITRLYVQNI